MYFLFTIAAGQMQILKERFASEKEALKYFNRNKKKIGIYKNICKKTDDGRYQYVGIIEKKELLCVK